MTPAWRPDRCNAALQPRIMSGAIPDPFPRCGRPLGHRGQCVSAAALARRALKRSLTERRDRARKKEEKP